MVRTFSVQPGYSRYLSASLRAFCVVRASVQMATGQAVLSSLTGFKKGLRLTGTTSMAGAVMASVKSCGRALTSGFRQKGKSCPLGANYPKANHPKIMGLLPLDG